MARLDLTNHFLIAMPTLADPNFYQTVTYLCAHNSEGAMGIVINRPLGIGLGEILAQLDLEPVDPATRDIAVYQGGPVQRDRGFVIYREPGDWASCIKICEDVGVATSRDILEAIAEGRGPREALVALGYAGWGAGQLERELADNAWLSGPADHEIIFSTPCEQRWQHAAAQLGIDLERLSHDVGHA